MLKQYHFWIIQNIQKDKKKNFFAGKIPNQTIFFNYLVKNVFLH